MVIDRQGFTDVIYFSSQPPSYFIEALRGGDVTLQQSESAWEFYQEHKRLMRAKGDVSQEHAIKAVTHRNGFGPVIISRRLDELLTLPPALN